MFKLLLNGFPPTKGDLTRLIMAVWNCVVLNVDGVERFIRKNLVIVRSCQNKKISDVSPNGFIRNRTDKTGRGGRYLNMLEKKLEQTLPKVIASRHPHQSHSVVLPKISRLC